MRLNRKITLGDSSQFSSISIASFPSLAFLITQGTFASCRVISATLREGKSSSS